MPSPLPSHTCWLVSKSPPAPTRSRFKSIHQVLWPQGAWDGGLLFPLSLWPFSFLPVCFCRSFENSFFPFTFFFFFTCFSPRKTDGNRQKVRGKQKPSPPRFHPMSWRYDLRTITVSRFQCDSRKFTDLCCRHHDLGWGHPPPHRKTRRAHAGSAPVPTPGPSRPSDGGSLPWLSLH